MSKEKKYRIVTDGKYFRIQSQRSFLGIKWWKFNEGGTLFIHFSNADQMMINQEKGSLCLRELRSRQKEARKEARKRMQRKIWRPIEKEN